MKIAFIIAHKYFRGYESYLNHYIDNIQQLYNESLIIIVDNNSINRDNIFGKFYAYDNIVILENNIACKFELGAYQIGINYLIQNNHVDEYDYIVFSQYTFILKNYFNFKILVEQNIDAATIVSWKNDWAYQHISYPIMLKLGIYNNLHESRLCWCNSFIVSNKKIIQLYKYISQIVITTRIESMASERYMGRILWELNNNKNSDIDGDIDNLSYYCLTVNPMTDVNNFFVNAQQKNENTI